MSFRRATARSLPHSATDLQSRLEAELKKPTEGAQPIIIAEPPGTGPITRLFVVWDDWDELSQQDRSEIIVNAYRSVFDLAKAAKLSVAMGLTTSEAKRMNIAI